MRLINRAGVSVVALTLAFTGLTGFTSRVFAQRPIDGPVGQSATASTQPSPTRSSTPKPKPKPSASATPTPTTSPTPSPTPTMTPTPTPTPTPTSTGPSALSAHIMFGASVDDLPYGRAQLPALETLLGRQLGVASAFVDWSYVIGGTNELWMANGGARKVLIAWEPNGIRFADVTSGSQDAYLAQVATSMKAFPYDVYVRPWPEMNGHWSTWQPTASGTHPDGGTPAQFIAAWRYLVTYMHSRGVTHLKFVFNPDASNQSVDTPIASIWPGESYVDVLGIDGYNWGNSALGAIDTGDRWQSFNDIFAPMYSILTNLSSTAPVWITEFGSKEPTEEDNSNYPAESSPIDPTHSKGTWIDELMASTNFPRMAALVYFNKKKERDWRLDSSAASLDAIRRAMAVIPR